MAIPHWSGGHTYHRLDLGQATGLVGHHANSRLRDIKFHADSGLRDGWMRSSVDRGAHAEQVAWLHQSM